MSRITRIVTRLLGMAVWAMACSNGFASDSAAHPRVARVGYSPTPVAAPLFVARTLRGEVPELRLLSFATPGDIGYALLSGDLDAGLVEVDRAVSFLRSPKAGNLEAIGAVQFPYGATLVVRKDLHLRLDDLKGKKIAARAPGCELLVQFRKDAARLGLPPETVRFVYLPVDSMLPALEARRVDAVILKGAHALLAEKNGHKVLYQNWKIEASESDVCCPPSLPQIEALFLVRKDGPRDKSWWLSLLEKANQVPGGQVRDAIASQIAFPRDALEGFPIPEFQPLSDKTRTTLLNKHHHHE